MGTVTVVAPAGRRSLTSPQRFRDVDPDCALDDAELERMIRRASGAIERFCGRRFARERVVERETGRGLIVLLLTHTPVVTLHSVTTGATAVLPDAYTLTPGAGLLRFRRTVATDEYMWRELGMPALYDTCDPPRTYAVEYTGGYIMPDDADYPPPDAEDAYPPGDYLPDDLEHACHLLLRGEIEAAGRGVGLTSERLGDAARTYAPGGTAGFSAAQPFLAPYKRAVL